MYTQIWDGEWNPAYREQRVACCDCGLVHDIYIRRIKGKLMQRVDRNERATAAIRRGKKVRKSIQTIAKATKRK